MVNLSDNEFQKIVSDGIDAIPSRYQSRLQNVAFIVEDFPSPAKRVELGLSERQSLFGLYEGVPLPSRGGATKLLPDKITIYKIPILANNNSVEEVRDQVYRTIWHEVAHYFGLGHKRIHELEDNEHHDKKEN